MGDYSDYRITQARMERAQERAKRQKRTVLLAGAFLAAIVVLFGLAASVRRAPARPPRLVLTWPSPHKYGKRTFTGSADDKGVANLGDVLARPNQPFTVSLVKPATWDATIVTAAGNVRGTTAKWRPAKEETLKVFARPAVSGWRKLFAWLQPQYNLRLTAHTAKVLDADRRTISQPVGWFSANVADAGPRARNGGNLIWDERAIPLLEAANGAVPYAGPHPGSRRSTPQPPPESPRWNLVPGFGDKRMPGDNGSYFAVDSAEALDGNAPVTMTKLARSIAALAPKANIKWIIADAGSSDARATLRLEFDNSGARGGWVKRSGETSATPLRWWDSALGETALHNSLKPSLPR